jgi:hypothetical protein
MDPNIVLTKLRELFASLDEDGTRFDDVLTVMEEVQENFEALDKWLTSGGFLPEGWQREIACGNCGSKRITR